MRAKVYRNRMEFIKKYIKNKVVLNVGCVGTASNEFLQNEISKYAKEVVGIDIDKYGLKKLKNDGYNVIYGDVQDISLNLERQFEVIVAGEIIEHLENQGIFLNNMKRHLVKNGVLIITTPNAREITYIINRLLLRIRDESEIIDSTHLLIHSKQTLIQLLSKYKFDILEIAFLNMYLKSKKKFIINLIGRMFPDFYEGILISARNK